MPRTRRAPVRRTRRTRRRKAPVRRRSIVKRNTNNTKIVEVDSVEKLKSVNHSLQKKRPALVWFYADWCGHCQSMKPEWQEFESKCGKTPGNKMVVKVNSNFQPNLTNNLADISKHVQGYPSIFQVRGNRLSRYEGERHHASLLKALRTL